ncbi:uncharacterized protein LOC113302707 isoform X1 [Papaver somniferum]|uniref:uncharacterized protein LOC113302707 isoform X1 n=1 Tax=Papaver somniferum TaxID=3469 RepID=UPI000E6F74E7|nr:uncharacterized protein LOC113302707 isoform X1 [Papaver somniferum]
MGTLVTASSIRKSSIQHHHLQWRNTSLLPSCEICNRLLFPRKMLHLHTLVRSFAGKKSVKKLRRDGKEGKMKKEELKRDFADESDFVSGNNIGVELTNDNVVMKSALPSPSRRGVLQACVVTSGLMFAVGLLIRQGSHLVVKEGWPIYDCFTLVSFDFETWHLELIAGLVILISSARFLLLKTWPNFAESSEASNQMVLSQLEPLDYILVACLPGLSEELLFRGALMPLFGLDWKSVLVVAAMFGVLHLGSGRKYSFAIWATFVGLAYGYATIISSSIIVPMTSHALNNLVGTILWRYISDTSEQGLE